MSNPLFGEVPPGWIDLTVGDVCERVVVGFVGPSKQHYVSDGVPFLMGKNVRNHGLNFTDLEKISRAFHERERKSQLQPGDVVVVRIGKSGTAATIPPSLTEANCGGLVIIKQPTLVSPEFLTRFLNSPEGQRASREEARGMTRQTLNTRSVEAARIPVPPEGEQRRIVAKLDAIFEQTRAAKARLERLPALLEKLKRSILAAAFRGDLTRDWRAAHPDVEPASILLDRIRAERRRRWEEALRANGKDPRKATYEEPPLLAPSTLPPLPRGWAWATVEQLLIERMCNGLSIPGSDTPPGTRALKLNALTDTGIDFNAVRYIRIDTETIEQLSLRQGDFLVSRGNGSLHLVGKGVAIEVDPEVPTVYPDTIIRLRPSPLLCATAWLPTIWGSPGVRSQIESKAKTTAGIFKISQSDIATIRVPVPPTEEQLVLSRLASGAMGHLTSLLSHSDLAWGRLHRLEQTTLAKAFRGELVPQDPNDEPASVLLERIRASRATQPESPRRERRPRREAPATEHSAESKTNGHTATAHKDESLDLVIAMFQQGKPRLTAIDITKATGLQSAAVKKALQQLVEGGQVRVHGRARGTTYEWTV